MTTPLTLTAEQVHALARRRRVPVGVICMACGRTTTQWTHLGHDVIRLGPGDQPVAQAVASPQRPSDFMLVRDVATKLLVSPMTVYRLIERGELDAVRVGRSFRISREAFNRYVQAATVQA